jgi:hypothetical protein
MRKKTEKVDVSKNVVLIFGIGCESVNKGFIKTCRTRSFMEKDYNIN